METNEVSWHLLKVYDAVRNHGGRLTAKEIAKLSGVAYRTARSHAAKLVSLGLFDLAEGFPAHRYQLSKVADKRDKAMILRLDAAREAFGLH